MKVINAARSFPEFDGLKAFEARARDESFTEAGL
jgi:hypothetical protein